jgi:hypothetical protein
MAQSKAEKKEDERSCLACCISLIPGCAKVNAGRRQHATGRINFMY